MLGGGERQTFRYVAAAVACAGRESGRAAPSTSSPAAAVLPLQNSPAPPPYTPACNPCRLDCQVREYSAETHTHRVLYERDLEVGGGCWARGTGEVVVWWLGRWLGLRFCWGRWWWGGMGGGVGSGSWPWLFNCI